MRRLLDAPDVQIGTLAAILFLLTNGISVGQQTSADVDPNRPLLSLPYTPSLDLRAMDQSADPCIDFYAYSCGGWMKKNPIPPDQPTWSVYGKLTNENLRFLWGILEQLAQPTGQRTPNQQKIGDLFASCMDESTANNLGAAPLKPFFDAIANLKSTKELAPVLAGLHLAIETYGWATMFGVDSGQDFADSSQVIAIVHAGGLGLPDRDYYLKKDPKSEEIRSKYLAHLQHIFALLGDSANLARDNAAVVFRIETALAKASLTRVERRDPYKVYHKMHRAELQQLMPSFDWNRYFEEIGRTDAATLNVTQPKFFKQWQRQLRSESLDNLKSYLRWHVIRAEAPYLSADFVQADFEFYSHTLRGVQQIRPRWKRCVSVVDHLLGEALGQEFVSRTFSPEMKKRTNEMAQRVETAMEQDITELSWMSPNTKREALEKLHSIVNKVGYPDRWRDYSSVEIRRGDFVGSLTRATTFEKTRRLAKIGKPVVRGEWEMTPPTVNAYYNPQLNDINFPAGVLQPPLYDPKLDDAPNYGNTGSTIGHELTHGFDDEGRKFDMKGNLRDWWTKHDAEEFRKRAKCISDQYGKYLVIDDIHINSKLTLGEDIADIGGTILAWMAWQSAIATQKLRPVDGLTPEQRFFIGFAQWACENDRPENLRLRAITDPHSPAKYRVNGVVVNMPEFQRAFICKSNQQMAPEARCRVW
jgi:putative endopeptidase